MEKAFKNFITNWSNTKKYPYLKIPNSPTWHSKKEIALDNLICKQNGYISIKYPNKEQTVDGEDSLIEQYYLKKLLKNEKLLEKLVNKKRNDTSDPCFVSESEWDIVTSKRCDWYYGDDKEYNECFLCGEINCDCNYKEETEEYICNNCDYGPFLLNKNTLDCSYCKKCGVILHDAIEVHTFETESELSISESISESESELSELEENDEELLHGLYRTLSGNILFEEKYLCELNNIAHKPPELLRYSI